MILLTVLRAALALTPPSGWVSIDEARAVRDVHNPARGELLEIKTSRRDAQGLALALLERGLSAQQSTIDPGGQLNIVLTDGRLGRALLAEEGWMLLLVEAPFARELDPDAILLASTQASPASIWGASAASQPAATPIDGGADGSPWGSAVVVGMSAGWVDPSTVAVWTQDPAVLGVWECSVLLSKGPSQLRFSFEDDGTVRLEQSISGRVENLVGTWNTREGKIRMDLPGSAGEEDYQSVDGTLTLRYDRLKLTLYRQ